MALIQTIRIQKFRSLNDIRVPSFADMNIFYGKNDVGKSNILKAVNLFFNGETDWKTPYKFETDYDARALAIKTKKKRLIKVEVTFEAPQTWSFTKRKFTVSKTWDTEGPFETNYIDDSNVNRITRRGARGLISKFINSIKYLYLPAVRGRDFLEHLYSLLQESLFVSQKENIGPAIKTLNEQIALAAKMVEDDFKGSTGIEVGISVPENLENLYRSFEAITKLKLSEEEKRALSMARRGDGIQARFMSALLFFVARQNKNYKYVWGFEEPENSLEYNLAKDLADTIAKSYTQKSQVLITSHSPAFIGYDSSNVKLYSVHSNDDSNVVVEPSLPGTDSYLNTIKEVHNLFASSIERDKELETLYSNYPSGKPVLICEGPCDKNVLIHFWNITRDNPKLTGNNSKHEPLFFLEIRGNTNDIEPLSGSNKRLHIAHHFTEKGANRVLIIEDRDQELKKELKQYTKIKRFRWSLKNIDSYFLDPFFVSLAFNVPVQEVVDYYNANGYTYAPDGFLMELIDGKDIYDRLNSKYGKTGQDRIEASHTAIKMTNSTSIPDDIKTALDYIEWVFNLK